jgi:hypothetical protein
VFGKVAERSGAILLNVHEYAKPRHCFQHKFSVSDKRILAPQTLNFKKRGLGERNSDTFEIYQIHHYFLNRIFIVIGCSEWSHSNFSTQNRFFRPSAYTNFVEELFDRNEEALGLATRLSHATSRGQSPSCQSESAMLSHLLTIFSG